MKQFAYIPDGTPVQRLDVWACYYPLRPSRYRSKVYHVIGETGRVICNQAQGQMVESDQPPEGRKLCPQCDYVLNGTPRKKKK